jgi:YidC/Oxa1 family membrane protein insertase
MIIIFSYLSPAGVALYWAVGGIVIVVQQLIVTFLMKPRMRKRIDEEFKNNPPKMADLPKDVTPDEAVKEGEKALEAPKKPDHPSQGRNAGKQNHNE